MITIIKAIRAAIKHVTMSDEERYLSKATDLADLERRQKRIMYRGDRSLWG